MIERLDYTLHTEDKESAPMNEDTRREKLCAMAESIFQEVNEIGTGLSAVVYTDPRPNGFCYKVIYNEKNLIHDVHEEAVFLNDARVLSKEVKVPLPIVSLVAHTKDTEGDLGDKRATKKILAMEKIEGVTLKELVDGDLQQEILPEDFDVERFFIDIRAFFKKLHEANIYHRDFHAGNLMIEKGTGKPVVIDFGLATKTYLTDEDPYKTDPDYRGDITIFRNDLDQIKSHEALLKEYLTK